MYPVSTAWTSTRKPLGVILLLLALSPALLSTAQAQCAGGWRMCYQCKGTGVQDTCAFANPYQEGFDSSKCRQTCSNCGGSGRVACSSSPSAPSPYENPYSNPYFNPAPRQGGQPEKIRWSDHAIRYETELLGSDGNVVFAAFDLYDLRTGRHLGQQKRPMSANLTDQGLVLSTRVSVAWDSTQAGPHSHEVVLLFRMREDGTVGFDHCNGQRCAPTTVH